MPTDQFDAIVIGAGHNGLITACYLARAGWKVLVLEKYHLVGGACVTEETFPGFKVSTGAYACSLLRPEIIRDCKLRDFGYEALIRDPSSFSPYPNNRNLLLWRDQAATCREIAQFSTRDAEQYPKFEAWVGEVSRQLQPLLMSPAVDVQSRRWSDWWASVKQFVNTRKHADNLVRLLSMSVADLLDRWFESDEVKVRFATDGVIGAMAGPRTPGTAYTFFHHVMGETDGQPGVWHYVRGGMGTVTRGLAAYLGSQRGVIETNASVERVKTKQNRACGVVLSDGREFNAPVVVSNADPKRTFLDFFDPLDLPEELLTEIRHLRFHSSSTKINIALSGLPNFASYPGTTPGPQHRGTIHFCPSMDYLEKAFDDAKWGLPAEKPMVELGLPSVIDSTLAPTGKHLASLFVQYAPYSRADGLPWNEQTEKAWAETVFSVIREYVTNWDDIVIDYQVLSPAGLEKRFGLTGGNIFHGELSFDQLFFLRPNRLCSRYETPIRGFYLCGSGVHPGGGVYGAPGYLAAKKILSTQRRPTRV